MPKGIIPIIMVLLMAQVVEEAVAMGLPLSGMVVLHQVHVVLAQALVLGGITVENNMNCLFSFFTQCKRFFCLLFVYMAFVSTASAEAEARLDIQDDLGHDLGYLGVAFLLTIGH